MKHDEVKHPNGYPYVLFEVQNENGETHFIQDIALDILQNKIKGEVDYANVNTMIKEVGHKKTNEILKSIKTEWTTKEGKVFFK